MIARLSSWSQKHDVDLAAHNWRNACDECLRAKSLLDESKKLMQDTSNKLRDKAFELGLPGGRGSLLRSVDLAVRRLENARVLSPLLQRLETLFVDREALQRGLALNHGSLREFCRFASSYITEFDRLRTRLELAHNLLVKYGERGTFWSVLPLEAALDAPEFVETVVQVVEKRQKSQRELIPFLKNSIARRLEICERHISLLADCEPGSRKDLDQLSQRVSKLKLDYVEARSDDAYKDFLRAHAEIDRFLQNLESLSQEAVSRKIYEASRSGWEILLGSALVKQKGRKARDALHSLQKPYQQERRNAGSRRRPSECLQTVSKLKKIIADS